jgi:hypothetical protein
MESKQDVINFVFDAIEDIIRENEVGVRKIARWNIGHMAFIGNTDQITHLLLRIIEWDRDVNCETNLISQFKMYIDFGKDGHLTISHVDAYNGNN